MGTGGGCMGTGRVHGDWEGAWGLGGCMGTGRVHEDWEGAWGLGGCMGTGRVHGDWEGAWGLGGCIVLFANGWFQDGWRKVFLIARLGDKYGGTGEECG